eukprot:NODE_230_length_1777_cov_383.021487.p1 GENE.NODE_230_length_1777_cov_383.021487~~NODE_230_length_1777_cov_383.021487.p1  ORF type:complete len:482 (-),score=131.56 NODE_230_length_1777_cov_383.021487:70-1515(-)
MKECRNGPGCPWLAQRRCMFGHEPTECDAAKGTIAEKTDRINEMLETALLRLDTLTEMTDRINEMLETALLRLDTHPPKEHVKPLARARRSSAARAMPEPEVVVPQKVVPQKRVLHRQSGFGRPSYFDVLLHLSEVDEVPADMPTEKPAEKFSEKPAEKAAEVRPVKMLAQLKPAEEKPSEKPAEKATAKPTATAAAMARIVDPPVLIPMMQTIDCAVSSSSERLGGAMQAVTPARDWQSPCIPPTIRRPWRVFEEDIEDKLVDAASQGAAEIDEGSLERLAAVPARGTQAAFAALPEEQQRQYAEVSIMELAAFVSWRKEQIAKGPVNGPTGEFEAAWDILDCYEKAEWLPDDPRAALAMDPEWAPLLVAEISPRQIDTPSASDYAVKASVIQLINEYEQSPGAPEKLLLAALKKLAADTAGETPDAATSRGAVKLPETFLARPLPNFLFEDGDRLAKVHIEALAAPQRFSFFSSQRLRS